MPDNPFAELILKLDTTSEWTRALAKRYIGQVLLSIQQKQSAYPAQPDRNRAKTFNTYVRGIGRLPRSAFFTKKGVARKKIQTKGAKRTSQRMSTRFKVKTETTPDGIKGTYENTADYSGWVLGPKEGDPHQVDFHAQTGWVGLDDAIEQTMSELDQIANQMLDDIARQLAAKELDDYLANQALDNWE